MQLVFQALAKFGSLFRIALQLHSAAHVHFVNILEHRCHWSCDNYQKSLLLGLYLNVCCRAKHIYCNTQFEGRTISTCNIVCSYQRSFSQSSESPESSELSVTSTSMMSSSGQSLKGSLNCLDCKANIMPTSRWCYIIKVHQLFDRANLFIQSYADIAE